MKQAMLLTMILALLPASLGATTVTATGDLEWLTNNSTAVVVGTVTSASFSRAGLTLSIVVSRSLEGPLTTGSTATVLVLDATAGDDADAIGATALWFLRGDTSAWTLLPATEGAFSMRRSLLRVPPGDLPPAYAYGTDDAAIDKVISELRAASEGPMEIAAPAYQALLALTTPSVRIAYRHAGQLGEPHFASCPMGRFLSTWERSLTQRVVAYAQANQAVPVDLAKSLCQVADIGVVPDVAAILGSASVGGAARRCAAQSLRNIHSTEALAHLRNLLDNPDREMQYMGLAGLALNANNVLPGRSIWSSSSHRGGASSEATTSNFPSYSAFVAAPDGYLAFWRNWYPNVAPSISGVSGGGGSCHPPAPWMSCTLPVATTATDANGDPLYFKWSTCSPALKGVTNCNVNLLGPNTVALEVSDGRGGVATTSVVLHGVNQTPTMQSFHWTPSHSLALDEEATLDFHVADDDAAGWAECRVLRVFGNCNLVDWGCSGNDGWVNVRATGHVGLCNVEVKWRDKWSAQLVERMSLETH